MTRPDTHEFALPPDVLADFTRRRFLAGGAGVALGGLAACGGEAEEASGPTTRRVRHVFGVTDVPAQPQRIFAEATPALGNLLALGAPVVAAPLSATAGRPTYLGNRLAGVADTGDGSELPLERLAALRPDLNVTLGAEFKEDVYADLAPIAPTVAPEYDETTLEGVVRYLLGCGRVAGREDVAQGLAADLDARIAGLRERLSTTLGDRPVTLLRVMEDGYSVRLGDTAAGLLDALGVQRPSGQAFDPEEFSIDLSLERVRELDAHVIFVYTDGDAEEERARLERNPLWQRLEAVRTGRVVFVEDAVAWAIGIDIVGVNVVLDEIERALLA